MVTTTLLAAETLSPNFTPKSVHEIRFRRPCFVHAFRIVAEGERPHPEIPFEGRTATTSLTLELFGCRHGGAASLCKSMLDEPFRRQSLTAPSAVNRAGELAATTLVDYLVIRCVQCKVICRSLQLRLAPNLTLHLVALDGCAGRPLWRSRFASMVQRRRTYRMSTWRSGSVCRHSSARLLLLILCCSFHLRSPGCACPVSLRAMMS